MILIDIDDTLNFLTLAVNFELIINSNSMILEDKKFICIEPPVAFLDEEVFGSQEFEEYLKDNYKKLISHLAWSKDAIASVVSYLQPEEYSVLYRGSISKSMYFETGGSVCEDVHDKLLEYGISAKSEYNVSFFLNKDVAKKIIKDYAEIYTASSELAMLAADSDLSVERIFLQINSSNNAKEISKSNEKIILVDNLFHMCQIRQILEQ